MQITDNFFKGLKDYGVFYVYHLSKEKIDNENIIIDLDDLNTSIHDIMFNVSNSFPLLTTKIFSTFRNFWPNIRPDI